MASLDGQVRLCSKSPARLNILQASGLQSIPLRFDFEGHLNRVGITMVHLYVLVKSPSFLTQKRKEFGIVKKIILEM